MPQAKPTEVIISPSVIEQPRPLAENRVLLHNVSWETFERLLDDVGDLRKTLFHYINGTLEIIANSRLVRYSIKEKRESFSDINQHESIFNRLARKNNQAF